jgi:hypothetical protein
MQAVYFSLKKTNGSSDYWDFGSLSHQTKDYPEYSALTPACCVLSGAAGHQFYSLWFDPTGSRTHDLPHSMRAR